MFVTGFRVSAQGSLSWKLWNECIYPDLTEDTICVNNESWNQKIFLVFKTVLDILHINDLIGETGNHEDRHDAPW